MNGTLTMILPLIILLAVMYFLLIRPQKKREKEINAMRSGVQVGDEIITIGGICGKIVKTKEESLVIQVGADKIKFEIMRWAVSKVVEESRRPSASAVEEEDTAEEAPKKSKPRRIRKAVATEADEETEQAKETNDEPSDKEAVDDTADKEEAVAVDEEKTEEAVEEKEEK